jgi:predicted esterase
MITGRIFVMKLNTFFKQKPVLSLILGLMFLAFTSAATAGEVIDSNNGKYYLSVPQTTKPMPVLVYLHGQGGDHNQGKSMFESYTNQANVILVSPEGGSPQKSWMMGSGPSVRKRVEEVLAKYENADKKNVFLVGYSAGGCVGYAFGTADSSFYKAMALVNASYQPGLISLQGQLPVYLIECEGDPNKPGAEMAKRDLESAGFKVKYDIIPASEGGGSHGYPTQTASPMIMKWIEDSAGSSSDNTSNSNDNGSGSDGTSNSDQNDSDSNTDSNSSGTPANSTGLDESPASNDESPSSDSENSNSTDNQTADDQTGEKPENKTDEGKNSSNVNESGNEGEKTEEFVEEPVVNSFGIPVGGLTDSEIESLVKEWLNNVFKPSQSPPDTERSWTLNDWGIWTCGNITHSGKIDGYGSITDFWLKTSPDCFSFTENRGSEMHVAEPSKSSVNDKNNGSEEETKTPASSTQSPDSDKNETPTENMGDKNSTNETAGNDNADVNDSNESNNNNEPTIEVSKDNNGSSSENVPDLAAPEPPSDNTPENVNGRQVNLYKPKGLREDGNSEFGLVVALSGIAGNTEYLKMKLAAGCDSNRCVFAGLSAKNASGSRDGYRWETDSAENVEFIRDVVKTIESKYGLSSSRTYLVGFSNGAYFTGSQGGSLDDVFEGFIMCEGGAIIPTSDKQILISGGGQTTFNSDKSGQKWLALCNGMGHFFPGQRIAQDPGIDKDSAGNTVNGTTMIKWLEE